MNRVTALLLAMATLLAHSLAIHLEETGDFAPPYESVHRAYHLARNADAFTVSSPGDMAAHLLDPARERVEILAAPYADLDFRSLGTYTRAQLDEISAAPDAF